MKYFVEHRPHPLAAHALALDLARHLYTRSLDGKVVVVAEEPLWLMRVVRKEWLNLICAVERERSKTLNLPRIGVLNRELARMKSLYFSTKTANEAMNADVFFVRPTQPMSKLLDCHTAYAICQKKDALALLNQQVQQNGLIVLYEKPEDCDNLDG